MKIKEYIKSVLEGRVENIDKTIEDIAEVVLKGFREMYVSFYFQRGPQRANQ